jgi:hypothetical protein
VLSVRPLRFRPDGREPEELHTDAYPPGVLRCVLHLTDVDGPTGALEFVDSSGREGALSGQAGTLVILDATRVKHCWQPVGKGERAVLEMALVPCHRLLERCVIWAGMNTWPVDPYNFSMTGFVDHPTAGSHFRFIENSAPWWLTL